MKKHEITRTLRTKKSRSHKGYHAAHGTRALRRWTGANKILALLSRGAPIVQGPSAIAALGQANGMNI